MAQMDRFGSMTTPSWGGHLGVRLGRRGSPEGKVPTWTAKATGPGTFSVNEKTD
jgi:hypothetical protein